MNTRNLLIDAVDYFGAEAQELQAIEECSELITALIHRRRGRITDNAVITEIADVMIMMEQLSLIFGKGRVEMEIEKKLNRLGKIIYK